MTALRRRPPWPTLLVFPVPLGRVDGLPGGVGGNSARIVTTKQISILVSSIVSCVYQLPPDAAVTELVDDEPSKKIFLESVQFAIDQVRRVRLCEYLSFDPPAVP